MEKGWTKIFITQDEKISMLLSSILNEQGINAVSINKKDSSYQMFGSIEIYVKDDNVKKAKKIINIYYQENSPN